MASFTLVLEDSVNNVALELATLKANVVNTLPDDIVIGLPTMAIKNLYQHFHKHLQPKRNNDGKVESGHCDCLTRQSLLSESKIPRHRGFVTTKTLLGVSSPKHHETLKLGTTGKEAP